MDKLIKASQDRYNRKMTFGVPFARDTDDLVTEYDFLKLLSLSRGLFSNNPIVKSAIEQKADYAWGNAGAYRSLSTDMDAASKMNAAIAQWSRVCEVSGMSLNDIEYLLSVKLDVDGDVFIYLTESKNGYPQVQIIEAHAIGSRKNGKIDLKNAYEEKGVIYAKKTRRPIKYRVLGNKKSEDQLIDVRDLIRVCEPTTSVRGIPLVSSTINILRDLEHSQELLLTQHLMAASVSMIEHNDSGTNEINLTDSESLAGDTLNVEVINNEGGEVRYFKSNSGGKIELLTNNNPSIPWQSYQDTLTNSAILALDWSRNLLGMSQGTGVNDRLALQQCAKAVQSRQNLLVPVLTRICNYAIAKMINNGYLDIKTTEIPSDWYECKLTRPKTLTVDFARDSKALLEEYKSGIKNLSQILDDEGIDYETHIRERYEEEAKRLKIKSEVEQEYNVELDDLTARLISPTQYQQTTQNENI